MPFLTMEIRGWSRTRRCWALEQRIGLGRREGRGREECGGWYGSASLEAAEIVRQCGVLERVDGALA